MRISRSSIWAPLLLLPLAACSGGSERSGASSMFITSCSLGCSGGVNGNQVFCSVVDVARNQEIAILFNDPVDAGSLNSASFRVVNTDNGATPVGTFFVDPANARRLVFRPAITFGLDGAPSFGFEQNAPYRIQIPGFALTGDAGGPYIQSQDGRDNLSPLDCTIVTSQPLVDLVPGKPEVEVFVEVVTGQVDGLGNPITETMSLEAPGILDERVYSFSPITMRFDDVMNPSTMADPLTRTSSFVFVEVDEDGDLLTDDDRSSVPGNFEVNVDLEQLVTTMVWDHSTFNSNGTFTETLGFPSSGSNDPPRKIALRFTSTVSDLVGNRLTTSSDGLTFGFVAEQVPIDPLILPGNVADTDGINPFQTGSEKFEFSNNDLSDDLAGAGETSNEDAERSGARWGGGRLAAGFGGGSGRLGDLVITTGSVVTLNTDSQTFPLTTQIPDLVRNDGSEADITVTNGAFEFGSIRIESGGQLVLEGSRPARIFARGEVQIAAGALLDLSGGTPEPHDSQHPEPQVAWPDGLGGTLAPAQEPGVGGPGGGQGGFGGSRNAFGVGSQMDNQGGLNTTDFPNDWVDADRTGRPGEAVRSIDEDGNVVATDAASAGQGGAAFPAVFPTTIAASLWNEGQFNVVVIPEIGDGGDNCFVRTVGGVGSGAAYASDGEDGVGTSTEPLAEYPEDTTPSNDPPVTAAATSTLAGAEVPSLTNDGYFLRTLEFDPLGDIAAYNLRGGAGGGGGGNHPYNTYASGFEGDNTNPCDGISSAMQLGGAAWQDHSGAAGGGGGGALQLTAGVRISVDGVIDASGGDGGSSATAVALAGRHAAPGGGGSGGAVLLQAQEVSLGGAPGRIDVTGGRGGSWLNTSFGGDGGIGLVRIETSTGDPLDGSSAAHDVYAPSLSPYDANGLVYGPGSVDFFSLRPAETFEELKILPDAYTASVSCWQRPPGNFFSIGFADDSGDISAQDPASLAWNMNVIIADSLTTEITRPFRGVNGVVHEYQNNLNYDLSGPDTPSVIAVRFQGARSNSELEDPCATGTGAPIIPSTLTPWVEHPADLNPGPGDTWPEPNYYRFAIFIDLAAGSSPDAPAGMLDFSRALRGVTDLWIRANPD